MFHISDIKKYLRCDRFYFYNRNENEIFQPYLRSDKSINELIVKYLNIDNCFYGEKNENNDAFNNAKDNYSWFCHPRFVDGELRINIPFMHKVKDTYDVYFVYYGTTIKELDLITYRISLRLLSKLGINVEDVYVIYLNENYVNRGELEADKLFILTDEYKGKKIKDIILESECDYESIIQKMYDDTCLNKKARKCKYCRQNGLCDYYSICFPDEEKIVDDSILTLVASKYKNAMYDEGISCLKNVDINRLEGNRVQYAQIMASRNNGIFIDKYALENWLKPLENKQLSFIDFEWDRYLIPPYKNMKPMDVLCFEYALYNFSNGELQHKTYVGTGDCREEFIKGLINNLPGEGPILAYNADGAEKLRLEELGNMFPEYKEKLDEIKDRFVDLATPFIDGLVYDVRMQGNYTLKKLVDIVSDYSYKDLDIFDGMEAVYNWRNIDKGSLEEEKIINDLKEYCSLDAYGLLLVYKWLTKLVSESK